MHDIRRMRADFPAYKALMDRRGVDYGLDEFMKVEEAYREALRDVEVMRAEQNKISKSIPELKKQGGDIAAIMNESRAIGEKIKVQEQRLREFDERLDEFLMGVPNVPHESVPHGASDADNVEVRKWGTPPTFDFAPQAHWDLGKALGILDMEAAAKITGSRFSLLRGAGARMERALINFMLNRHTSHGYVEVSTPLIVNRRSATGTGQLPKFEDEMMFKLESTEYFLNPTAEVPVTNIHQDEIVDGANLPIKYCAFAASFRKEGGSAGRDTRGLIRMHQFPKVEIVHFTRPEDSYDALESLTADAEDILQQLNLPYRVVSRCTGDLGFAAAKGYDLEVWMPSYERYVEISSTSNFEAFQARRANIRYKDAGGKPFFVHTLNGSGLAVNRTLAAILENNQCADGTVTIPDVLKAFMGAEKIF